MLAEPPTAAQIQRIIDRTIALFRGDRAEDAYVSQHGRIPLKPADAPAYIWTNMARSQHLGMDRHVRRVMGKGWGPVGPAERFDAFIRACCAGSPVQWPDLARAEVMAAHLRRMLDDKLPASHREPHPHPFYNAYIVCKMLQEQVKHLSFYTASRYVAKHFPMLFAPAEPDIPAAELIRRAVAGYRADVSAAPLSRATRGRIDGFWRVCRDTEQAAMLAHIAAVDPADKPDAPGAARFRRHVVALIRGVEPARKPARRAVALPLFDH